FFFSSRRRHTRWPRDWSSDVCSSDLKPLKKLLVKRVTSFSRGSSGRKSQTFPRSLPCLIGLEQHAQSGPKRIASPVTKTSPAAGCFQQILFRQIHQS